MKINTSGEGVCE